MGASYDNGTREEWRDPCLNLYYFPYLDGRTVLGLAEGV